MKRLIKPFFGMTVLFSFIYSLLFLLASYDESQTMYDRFSNQLYYENKFIIDNINSENLKSLIQAWDDNFRIIVEVTEHCRLVIKDCSVWEPPMIFGIYPDNDANICGAIIGKNVMPIVLTEDKEPMQLDIQGERIDIIGVLGPDYITASDELIILFGYTPERFNLVRYQVTIDSPSRKCMDGLERYIKEKMPESTISYPEAHGTTRITKSSFYFRLIYIETILLALFSLQFLINSWHKRHEDVRKIFFIFGIPSKRLLIYEFFYVMLANGIAFIVITILVKFTEIIVQAQLLKIILTGIFVSILSCLFFAAINSVEVIERFLQKLNLEREGKLMK